MESANSIKIRLLYKSTADMIYTIVSYNFKKGCDITSKFMFTL